MTENKIYVGYVADVLIKRDLARLTIILSEKKIIRNDGSGFKKEHLANYKKKTFVFHSENLINNKDRLKRLHPYNKVTLFCSHNNDCMNIDV